MNDENLKRLQEAREQIMEKEYIWKNQDGTAISLMGMPASELKRCYQLCYSILYSASEYVGKMVNLENLQSAYNNCLAELFIREQADVDAFYVALCNLLNKAEYRAAFPPNKYQVTPIGDVIFIDSRYEQVPVSTIKDACLKLLDKVPSKLLSYKQLTSLPINLTQFEYKQYTLKYPWLKTKHPNLTRTGININDLLEVSRIEGSSYKSLSNRCLEAMVKIIPPIERRVKKSIALWKTRLRQIEEVARIKNVELEHD